MKSKWHKEVVWPVNVWWVLGFLVGIRFIDNGIAAEDCRKMLERETKQPYVVESNCQAEAGGGCSHLVERNAQCKEGALFDDMIAGGYCLGGVCENGNAFLARNCAESLSRLTDVWYESKLSEHRKLWADTFRVAVAGSFWSEIYQGAFNLGSR